MAGERAAGRRGSLDASSLLLEAARAVGHLEATHSEEVRPCRAQLCKLPTGSGKAHMLP